VPGSGLWPTSQCALRLRDIVKLPPPNVLVTNNAAKAQSSSYRLEQLGLVNLRDACTYIYVQRPPIRTPLLAPFVVQQ
jgi:hypothetical protein